MVCAAKEKSYLRFQSLHPGHIHTSGEIIENSGNIAQRVSSTAPPPPPAEYDAPREQGSQINPDLTIAIDRPELVVNRLASNEQGINIGQTPEALAQY